MARKVKYTWSYSDDNEMFFWSENSTNNYLSGKELFMPKNLFDEKSGKIKTASKNSPSVFSHYGIIRAGFSWKAKNYYQVSDKRVPTANSVAKKLKITLSELNDICLENFSATFPKLVLKHKLEHSIDLLNKGENVVEISKKLGYSSPFAFSRAFKNYFETAPSLYAKRKSK